MLKELFRKSLEQRPGLVYEEDFRPNAVFASHRVWWGKQPLSSDGILTAAIIEMNPAVRRCRIGRITLKEPK